jgi:hypothetical protein
MRKDDEESKNKSGAEKQSNLPTFQMDLSKYQPFIDEIVKN